MRHMVHINSWRSLQTQSNIEAVETLEPLPIPSQLSFDVLINLLSLRPARFQFGKVVVDCRINPPNWNFTCGGRGLGSQSLFHPVVQKNSDVRGNCLNIGLVIERWYLPELLVRWNSRNLQKIIIPVIHTSHGIHPIFRQRELHIGLRSEEPNRVAVRSCALT